MINHLAIVIRHPWGNERAVLGLRTALAAQTGGFEASLVLLGEGVWNLTGARPAYLDKLFASFLENEGGLFCLESDLERRGLTAGELTLRPQTMDPDDLGELMAQADSINLF